MFRAATGHEQAAEPAHQADHARLASDHGADVAAHRAHRVQHTDLPAPLRGEY